MPRPESSAGGIKCLDCLSVRLFVGLYVCPSVILPHLQTKCNI